MFNLNPVVSIEKAFIYQKDRIVLNNVNFSINKGEFVFLIGRTGSGKSSLLKTLGSDTKKLNEMLILRMKGVGPSDLGTKYGVDHSTIIYHCKR